MMEEQRSLRIPISSSSDFVEIFPDEIPNDVNSLLDVLRAEYAPLKIWRGAALEYYRQHQLENFNEVLNEIVSCMSPEIEDHYRQMGDYEQGIVEIFDSLAAFSLYQSYSFVEDPQNLTESSQKLEALKGEIVASIKKAEAVSPMNEYTWIIRGFYELSYGELAYAEHYLKNVYTNALKQSPESEKRVFLHASTLGLAAIAYARKKYSVALDFFVKAMQCNPLKSGNNVRIAVATCCFKLEQYDRCRLAVDRVLSLDPSNIDALLILSLLQRVEAGKFNMKKRKEYHRVARDLCSLVTQLDPSSALALNQMANYKFDDWKVLDMKAVIKSSSVFEVVHDDDKKNYSILESLHLEDMFRVKTGLVACVVSEAHTSTNEKGNRVTTIVVKPECEMPLTWIGREVILTSTKSKNDLNEVCRIAARALRGSGISEVRAESYYILGRVYHLLSQYENALKFYEDALNLMPDLSLASFGIGQLLLAKEEFASSHEKFQEVLKKHPEDRDTIAYIMFIQAYHLKQCSTFEKLRECAPGFVFEADLWLAQAHAMHQKGPGEYAMSLKCYEMAHSVMQQQSLIPHNHVLLNMGVLYHAVGNLDRAMHFTLLSLEACDKLASVASGDSSLGTPSGIFLEARNDVFYSWTVIDDLHVQVTDPSTLPSLLASPESVGKKGGVIICLHVVEGDVSSVSVGGFLLVDGVVLEIEAIDAISQLIRCRGMISLPLTSGDNAALFAVQKKIPRNNFNNDTIAHCFNLARILEDSGQTQAAIELYTQLVIAHPSFLECYLRLSMINSDLGRKDDALIWVERGMALDRDNIDTTVVLADLYCQMESWELAKVKFEKVCKERRNDARAVLSLGNLYFANSANSSSLRNTSMKFFHAALKEDHRNIYASNGLGMICAKEGKQDVARDVFSRAREAKLLPPSTDIIANMGHVHLQQGRHVDAIRIYESVLKALPNSSCTTHVSQSASNLIQPTVAPLLRHVLTSTFTAVSDCLSLAHYKHKQYEDAMKVQMKSLHLDPTQTHVWFNLAYMKEEFAVASLMKPHKSTVDIQAAIGQLDEARNLFSALSDPGFCAGAAKHKIFSPSKAEGHVIFCENNLAVTRDILHRAREDESQRQLERAAFNAEQVRAVEEKERARLEKLEVQIRAKALRLERAVQNQQMLEQSWQATVGAATAADSTTQKKKKSNKSATKDGQDVTDFMDRMDDEREQVLFDSDEDEEEEDLKQTEVDKAKETEVFGSDSSDGEEEEFNAFATNSNSQEVKPESEGASGGKANGRLKRRHGGNDDDEEEGDLDLDSAAAVDGGDVDSDVVKDGAEASAVDEGPARQRRKVIDDDDDDE